MVDGNVLADADINITYHNEFGSPVADCQGGTDPAATPFIVPGTEIQVQVTDSYNSFGLPFLGPVFNNLVLTSTQERTLQSGWDFG